jgi:hypothetical protein
VGVVNEDESVTLCLNDKVEASFTQMWVWLGLGKIAEGFSYLGLMFRSLAGEAVAVDRSVVVLKVCTSRKNAHTVFLA